MTDFSIRFEKDLLNCLKILVSKKKYKKILKQNDYDFSNCFVKGLIAKLSSSNEFQLFVLDLYSKKLLKKYYFSLVEEIDVAEIFLKKYKAKTSLIFKNKFNYYCYNYLSKMIIKILIFFLSNQNNNHLRNLNNIFFYIIGYHSIGYEISKKIYSDTKKIFTKFFILKNFLYFFTTQKNFFIKSYSSNDYLLINKMLLNFFLIQRSITILKPKIIVSFEGDAWDHEMLYLLSKKIGFKSIVIQTATDLEVFQKAGFHNLKQTKMLVWGKHYQKIYQKICPNQKIIKVVGNLLIFKKKKFKRNKIGILLQKRNNKISFENLEKFKELVYWLCKTFDKKIIIRPHPLDDDDYYNLKNMTFKKKIIIHDPKRVPIGETLNECSMIFAKYTSTIVEAASSGIVPVILETSLKFEKKIDDLRNFDPPLISRSINQIKKTITILHNNDKKRGYISRNISNKFRNHINYFGKDSLKRIKSEIKAEI